MSERTPQIMQSIAYASPETQWLETTDRTLVVACSDPRFRKATESFIENTLQTQRFAPLFLPGGPATILLSSSIFFAVRPLIQLLHERFQFLRVIGVHHKSCAYYHKKYIHLKEEEIYKKQIADLIAFKVEMERLIGKSAVIGLYFADHDPQNVHFEHLA